MTQALWIFLGRSWIGRCFVLALLLTSPLAHSQYVCSSDGQTVPPAIFERFINADCESCWSDSSTPNAPTGALVLDWILPGSQGEEAALAAAASRDALMRLDSQKLTPPNTQSNYTISVSGWPGATLRVANGMAVGGYVGASIELKLPAGTSLEPTQQAWLVLVETLPIGFEGSPVPRNLVRNVLNPTWNMNNTLLFSEQFDFREIRPLNIPQGVNPERLRVVGWVQNAGGQLLVAAQSVCPPADSEPQ